MSAAAKAKGLFLYAESGTSCWNVCPWIWSNGGAVTNKNYTKASGYLNSPKSVAAVQMLVDLYKAGEMPKIIVDSNGGVGTYDGIDQKKYVSALDGPWSFAIFGAAFKNTQLAGTTVPAGPSGSVSVVGGEDIVMTKASKNKAAAAEFIRFMDHSYAQMQMARVGQMPVLKSSTKALVKIHPYYATYLKQIATAQPRTPTPKWPQIDQVITTEVAKAFTGSECFAGIDERSQQIESPRRSSTGSLGSSALARGAHASARRRRETLSIPVSGAGLHSLWARNSLPDRPRSDQPLPLVDRPGTASDFIGFGNYSHAFHDPIFWRALVNTGFYMAVTVPAQIIIGMAVAVLLDARMPGRGLFRTLYYLPVVTSGLLLPFRYMFITEGGVINWLLHYKTHLVGHNIEWLSHRWSALAAISILGIWKGVGWAMAFLSGSAADGPVRSLKEGARVDGANAWSRFRAVSLPAILPVVAFVTVMLVIGGFNVFISVFLMTNGGPLDETQVLLTYMYRQAFSFLDFGYGSSIAFTLTLIVFAVSIAQLRLFRRPSESL